MSQFDLHSSYEKIAVVHDDFIQHGGAEKIAEAFLEIFPKADLFTSIISEEWEQKLKVQHPNLNIRVSFLNKFPLKGRFYKYFALFYPLAFYLFSFNDYDLVISSSSRFAHGVKTNKNTLHLAYIHSPARMIWEPRTYFHKMVLIFVFPFVLILRAWDKRVSAWPRILIANSRTTQSRIKKYWGRKSEIVNPFHSLNIKNTARQKIYYLIVSRLEKWKRIDLAIEACNQLKQKLVIVGDGKYKKNLQNMADTNYVKFTGRLSDSDLVNTYLNSKALILTQKEDFGITALEAQSLGIPVIAYKSGGATETVIENKTGLYFDAQRVDSLKKALVQFEQIEFDPQECIIQAGKFTKDQFKRNILDKLKHG